MNKLEKAAQTVITQALDLRKGEAVLIIADEPLLDLAHLLFAAAEKKTAHVHLLEVTRTFLHRNALCAPVERLMQEMNVILALTSVSISHINSRREACRHGARCITMPAITNDTFARIAEMDFGRIGRLSRKLADILTIAREIEISAPNGTRLHIAAARAKGYADTGEVTQPGAFSNLPAGEAALAPEFAGTSGELIVDSGMGVQLDDRERTLLSIRDGRIVRISGGQAANRLRRALAPFGPEGRLIAEFGIGTNESARICGHALEDEKVLGTIHIAVGNNLSFGGKNDVPIHLDAIAYKASVAIDGRKVLEHGKLVLE
ncbi:MAG TPA: aminopeptidase [bacterium]|nr:aminopeptidase [bacterium]